MMIALSPVLRRALAAGLLGAILVIVWTVIFQPSIESWSEASGRNAQAARLVAAYKDALRDEPRWQSLEESLRDPSYTRAFIQGSDQDLASARFQADMKQAIESTNASITSIQVLSPTKDRDVAQLNERVTLSAPLGVLPAIVRQIEQRIPYVFIDSLTITAPENAPQDRQVQVTVTSDFHAYLLPGAP
jgi:hypothetical protein